MLPTIKFLKSISENESTTQHLKEEIKQISPGVQFPLITVILADIQEPSRYEDSVMEPCSSGTDCGSESAHCIPRA